MQIKANALVVSADGKEIGRVHCVIIDTRNGEVRHIVVRKGMLLTEDRAVPINPQP